jgi:hypothetical protein
MLGPIRRWRRRKHRGDGDLGETERAENERLREDYEIRCGIGETATHTWQKITDDEFKPPGR